MNHREFIIYRYLVQNSSSYLTYDALSAFHKLSVSTIRHSLNNIDQVLIEKSLHPIIRKPRYGVKLDKQESIQQQDLLSEVAQSMQTIDFSITDNRQAYILFVILSSVEKVSLDTISETMEVSRRTIQNDISSLKKELEVLNCMIIYEKDSYAIKGNAVTIRTLIVNKLRECITTPDEYEIIGNFESLYKLVYPSDHDISSKVQEIYDYLQTILPVNYTPTSYLYILVYVASLAAYSVKIDREHFSTTEEVRLEESTLFELAKTIINKTQTIFNCDINYYETYYLTVILHSLPVTDYSTFDKVYPVELELLVNQLILRVSERMDFLFYEDKELPTLIINHTIPAIQRMKFDSQIKNPLTSIIEQKYPLLHDAVIEAIGLLETYVGIDMVSDERALFTLYFASSMEKLQMHAHPRDILIVCNSGNAVSRLLQYRLNNAFDINIIGFVSGHRLNEAIAERRPDLIITVLNPDESEIQGIPMISISPLLTNTDIQNLQRHLNEVMPRVASHELYSESELLKYLTPEMFAVDVSVRDHEALIRYSGELLRKGSCANAAYGEEMIAVTKRFGSLAHFLIAPNIILPHAGISDNVYQTGFSFAKLDCPISVNEHSISIAIALCTTDKKSHEKAVRELGKLFNDKDFLEDILSIKNYREFSQLVLLTLRKED